jgi:hypothetical protein
MAVSNLAELRNALRQPDTHISSDRGLVSAVRSAQNRIVEQLNQSGRAEVVDGQGNRFIIERRNG